MNRHKLKVWRTVGPSSVLGLRSIGTFPFASLLVVAALLMLRRYHFPEAWRELPGYPIWTSLLYMLARTAVLAPLAIIIHRSIVLGERGETYWAMWRQARTVRFLIALILLDLVEFGSTVLGLLAQREWVQEALYGMLAFWTASLVLWTRLCLAFPIIATDYRTPPFLGSYRYTRGAGRPIFLVFCVIGAIHIALGILASNVSSAVYASLWFGASWTAVSTFFFITYVCVASHLWRTRANWSDRGGSTPPAGTAFAVP
jgi:hypothetical protein